MFRSLLTVIVLLSLAAFSHGASFVVTTDDGREQAVVYSNKTLRNKGVRPSTGKTLDYANIVTIVTGKNVVVILWGQLRVGAIAIESAIEIQGNLCLDHQVRRGALRRQGS